MSEPSTTPKRERVAKPEKKSKKSKDEQQTPTIPIIPPEEALIDIPAIKKKKERRVKTEADILAKQERKRLRQEQEAIKKGISVETLINKTPKWKQFLVNTSATDNSEALKDTSYKVKGDDGSGDDDESENESDQDEKSKKKRKAKKSSKDKEEKSSKKSKKEKKDKESKTELLPMDLDKPGLAYLVEWKQSKATWKFQKLRQVWLLNHIYSDTELPSSHWKVFLEYIKDLKGAAKTNAVKEAQKILDGPSEEEKAAAAAAAEAAKEKSTEDTEMTNADDEERKEGEETDAVVELTEEEKAAKEAAEEEAMRVQKVKESRALDVLKVLA